MHLGPRMRATEEGPLASGACVDLPIEVADKYFMADRSTERFQFLTAKAICGHCAVQAACLIEAIEQQPIVIGVRGGESARAISHLRYRHLRGEASASALAAEAILRQLPLGGLNNAPRMRGGHFADAEVLAINTRTRAKSTLVGRQETEHNADTI
jgi:hypothetical protein